jgi:hypothetical protein
VEWNEQCSEKSRCRANRVSHGQFLRRRASAFGRVCSRSRIWSASIAECVSELCQSQLNTNQEN